MKQLDPRTHEFTHFCLFAGAGGLSLGLSSGQARVGVARARLRCLGGVDVWPTAVQSFERFTGSRGTCLDLFDREDYVAFHGHEPPADWREATPEDVRAAAGGECPDILATSPPCKGFSGLLNAAASDSPKYQALNRLTIRGLALALAAFADDPPALVLLENVPRIQTRGRELLDTITGLLRSHGYAVAETTHDCGELGGLAQHRRRFLLVARHTQQVRPFLYEPPHRRVRAIGEVLEHLPMPEAPGSGPMHRLPRLTWQTWARLALIEPGKDWRSLQDLVVVDGYLRDIAIVPMGTGAHSIADPRVADSGRYQPYGVVAWDEVARTVTGQAAAGAGPYSVADPWLPCDVEDLHGRRHCNVYRLARWDEPSPAVTGMAGGNTRAAVADPRMWLGENAHANLDRVIAWGDPGGTVTGALRPAAGAMSVADPRPGWNKSPDGDFANSGHYGVNAWDAPAPTVTARAKLDRGSWSVADPRVLPGPHDRPDPVPRIVALDGSWHRPLTTMELAALQSYPVFDGEGRPIPFAGTSDSAWREQIGNSVPPEAAKAIGDEMARTLLLEQLGTTFNLSDTPVWVRPFVTALAVAGIQEAP